MYSTNVREPVRADEKHLGRIKRHFIDTDVQLGNYELREVSRYRVALKASRTARGVPLLEDMPGLGMLFRPLPQAESSLQQNIILAQATIFPTLFDLMGLRWAPAVADLDTLRLQEEEFVYRKRKQFLRNDVYDHSSNKVDEFLRIPEGDRRPDLYRNQESIPLDHPNGYTGPGLNRQDSQLKEGYSPESVAPPSQFIPGATPGNTAPMIRTPQGQIFEIWDDPQSRSVDSVSPVPPGGADCPPPAKGAFLPPPPAPGADGSQSRLDAPSRLHLPETTQPLSNQTAGRTQLDLGWTTRPVSPNPPSAAPDVSVRQTAPSGASPERQFRPLPQTERQSARKLWPFNRKEATSTETDRADAGKVDPANYEEPSSPPSSRMRLPVPNFLRRK